MRVPRIIGNWSSGAGDNSGSSDVIAADFSTAFLRISAFRQNASVRWYMLLLFYSRTIIDYERFSRLSAVIANATNGRKKFRANLEMFVWNTESSVPIDFLIIIYKILFHYFVCICWCYCYWNIVISFCYDKHANYASNRNVELNSTLAWIKIIFLESE